MVQTQDQTQDQKIHRKHYDGKFFTLVGETAARSAETMVPLVMELVNPKRVVDVGCGPGAWMRAFKQRGCTVRGYDGDYVDVSSMVVDPSEFHVADLRQPLTDSEGPYDLAVSLEVGEHLPQECAAMLVKSLVGLAPVVLFSAAIPGQGGTLHINEQWQSYWAELFQAEDYVAIDCIRPQLWRSEAISFFYVQNALLYCRADQLQRFPALSSIEARPLGSLDIVHPVLFHTFKQLLDNPDPTKVPIVAACWNFVVSPWRFVQAFMGFCGRRLGR